jgi:hypothetical protein
MKFPDYATIQDSIKEKNYVEIPLFVSTSELNDVANKFLAFLKLNQSIKDEFTIMVNKNDRGSHAGYIQKSKTKGDSDNKEYFHYRVVTETLLENVIDKYGENKVITDFLSSAKVVFEAGREMLKNILKVLDAKHPGIYEKLFSDQADKFQVIRFVKYDPEGVGKFLASPHYDRGSCSIAMAESAPGLRAGRTEESLRLVEREDNTAVFMPALTFHKDINSEDFPPTWHDVVQKKEDVIDVGMARWAIIFFADVSSGEKISFEDAHTPKNY